MIKRVFSSLLLCSFILSSILPNASYAQMISLPVPGTLVSLSPAFTPACLKGMVINVKDPFKFDFIINRGDLPLSENEKKTEYTRLVKYFLASLTVPDTDQWVNLSPYERNRIIADNFGQTEMGRDLLAQDYLLKQITSSLSNPDSELGKQFWSKLYDQAYQKYGNTEIPTDVFNKVWITPDAVKIYEKDNTVYVVSQHLKVQLEADYLASRENGNKALPVDDEKLDLSKSIMREVIIPALDKEVNEGKNFAQLRQIYSGMLLAAWYKRALKESILTTVYGDKSKLAGVNQDPKNNEKIYAQYIESFQKGAYNFIREDVNKYTQEALPRKYFSGGATDAGQAIEAAMTRVLGELPSGQNPAVVDLAQFQLQRGTFDAAESLPHPSVRGGTIGWLGSSPTFPWRGESWQDPTVELILQQLVERIDVFGKKLLRNFVFSSNKRSMVAIFTDEIILFALGADGVVAELKQVKAFYNERVIYTSNPDVLVRCGVNNVELWMVRANRVIVFPITLSADLVQSFGSAVLEPVSLESVDFPQGDQVRLILRYGSRDDENRSILRESLVRLQFNFDQEMLRTSAGIDIPKRTSVDPMTVGSAEASKDFAARPDLQETDSPDGVWSVAGGQQKIEIAHNGGTYQTVSFDLEPQQRVTYAQWSQDSQVLYVTGWELNERRNRSELDWLFVFTSTGIDQFSLMPGQVWNRRMISGVSLGRGEGKIYTQGLSSGQPLTGTDETTLFSWTGAGELNASSSSSSSITFNKVEKVRFVKLSDAAQSQRTWSDQEVVEEIYAAMEARRLGANRNQILPVHIEAAGAILRAGGRFTVRLAEKPIDGQNSSGKQLIIERDESGGRKKRRRAAAPQPTDSAQHGGIDLAQSNLDMQIERDGNGVPLPVSQQKLDNLRIDGLVPVLTSIRPASTLPMFRNAAR